MGSPDERIPSVVVIGHGFEVLGSMPVGGSQRVSDHLNERRAMLILEEVELEGCDHFATRSADIAINRRDILLVIPFNEAEGDAMDRRITKTRHTVRMLVDEWIVEGVVHLLPEHTLERFINIGQGEFIPVTDAILSGPSGDRAQPLVLVARHQVQLLIAVSAAPSQRISQGDVASAY